MVLYIPVRTRRCMPAAFEAAEELNRYVTGMENVLICPIDFNAASACERARKIQENSNI